MNEAPRRKRTGIKGEWEKLRFNAPSGLFHLWQVEDSIEPTWEEKMVTEN
jgi:hypothetical protein